MAWITIQVIEGLERGQVYEDLPTPVTIGREDDNRIRLNDERVSRFHAKIQEDAGRIILTDLESTNGTRVNGQPVQIRVLQPGDQLTIGRCLLVYGSREQIADRMSLLASWPSSKPRSKDSDDDEEKDGTFLAGPEDDLQSFEDDGIIPRKPLGTALFPRGIPTLPSGLNGAQRAEFSDVVAYVHDQIQNIIQTSSELPGGSEGDDPTDEPHGEGMFLPWIAWQRLLLLEADLAAALRRVADPDA